MATTLNPALFAVPNITVAATDHRVAKSPDLKHGWFYDLSPHADYSIWTAPAEFWQRDNGNVDKKAVYGNEANPLVKCIHNANKSARTGSSTWVTTMRSIERWAKQSSCTEMFLMAAILASKDPNVNGGVVRELIIGWMDDHDIG